MHGGGSPGAPKGEANGNYRHGCFTNEAIELRRELNEWARLMKKFAERSNSRLKAAVSESAGPRFESLYTHQALSAYTP